MASSSSSAAPRIFSSAEWKTLYSDEEYKKITRSSGNFLHFLIARNKPESIIKEINSVNSTAHDLKNHRLTPLIIATMRGSETVVDELLKQDVVKKTIDATDEYGWTALHHAALTSDAIFQKLIAAGANPNRLTNMRGTPADLRALTTPGIRDDSTKSVLFEGKPLTQQIAQEIFGLTYRDIAFYPPECLKELWKQTRVPEEPVADYAIQHPADRFPKVEIIAIDKEKGFYGLVAAEDIPTGTLFGEYGGVFAKENLASGWAPFSPENGKKAAYLFGGFDAKEVGNLTRFINSGFSNVGPLSTNQRGMTQFAFLSNRAIQKGEPILFNYGEHAHELTYGQQTLFNREKIHEFFKGGLKDVENRVRTADENVKKSRYLEDAPPSYLHRMDVRDHSTFPLDNPACLIDLHASGIVSAAEWIKPISYTNELLVKEWLRSRGLVSYTRVLALALHLAGLDRAMEQKYGSSAPLRNWLKEHCQAYKVVDLVKAMEWIAEDPSCIGGIEERLKDYDWTKDESNLYSYQNRRAALERKFNFDLFISARDLKLFLSTLPEKRKEQLQKMREVCLAESAGFAGSEFERMLNEIEESSPKNQNEITAYLPKIIPVIDQINTYCR